MLTQELETIAASAKLSLQLYCSGTWALHQYREVHLQTERTESAWGAENQNRKSHGVAVQKLP